MMNQKFSIGLDKERMVNTPSTFHLIWNKSLGILRWPQQSGRERCHAWKQESLEVTALPHLAIDPRRHQETAVCWCCHFKPFRHSDCTQSYQPKTYLFNSVFFYVVNVGDSHLWNIPNHLRKTFGLISEQNTTPVQAHILPSICNPKIPLTGY